MFNGWEGTIWIRLVKSKWRSKITSGKAPDDQELDDFILTHTGLLSWSLSRVPGLQYRGQLQEFKPTGWVRAHSYCRFYALPLTFPLILPVQWHERGNMNSWVERSALPSTASQGTTGDTPFFGEMADSSAILASRPEPSKATGASSQHQG